jgi:hypothetical protein
MTTINQLYSRLINAMGVEDLEIPMTAVKFYKKEDEIPEPVKENQPTISLTSCQAAKQASLGDAALLTYDNIGCVAAAITFGLVDKDQTEPLGDSKVYTDIMRDQSGLRAGTENIGSILAFGLAAKLANSEMEKENRRLLELRDYFLEGLRKIEPGIIVNGSMEHRTANNLNIGFPGIDSGSLLLSLNQIGIYVSSGSACSAGRARGDIYH